jgi:Asp-tRNA(Asn)/Glu-tRNA(Gln) amidotransferase A subunit family amidase
MGISMDELTFLPAVELAEAIRTKQVSSLELTDHYISRVER